MDKNKLEVHMEVIQSRIIEEGRSETLVEEERQIIHDSNKVPASFEEVHSESI